MPPKMRFERYGSASRWFATRVAANGRRYRCAIMIVAATIPAPALAQTEVPPRSDLSASVGTSVWHGDFGAPTDTTILSTLASLRYRINGLRIVASIPYMRIESDGAFFAGIGGTPLFVAPNSRTTRRVRDGLGDLTLGASYLLPGSDDHGLDIDLHGRVKLPTASSGSGLSTGKTDYSLGVDVARTVGRVTPSVSATYRIFGDNATWQFRDGFDLAAGASYALPGSTVLLANYEYIEASSRFIRDSHEVVLGASTRVTDRLRASGYLSKGLSSGAAAIAGGASLTIRL